MKIIILGGGYVGLALAEQLVKEQHEVTVIEPDRHRLQILQESLDLRGIIGQATYPDILQQAGAAEADCLVAATDSDEVNLLACQIAYTLFKTPRRISLVSAEDYYRHQSSLFQDEHGLAVNHLFSPKQWIAEAICQFVAHPGVQYYGTFVQRHLTLVALKVTVNHSWLQGTVVDWQQQPAFAQLKGKMILLRRHKRILPMAADQTIEVGDELWCLVVSEQLDSWLAAWHRCAVSSVSSKRVMIVGGGMVGAELARRLSGQHRVKIIERDRQRSCLLAEMLPDTVIFCSDGADQALLLEEHIEEIDQFIAVTNDDEDNILSALLAHHLGAKRTLVLVQRSVYCDLIENQGIDQVIIPQPIILSKVLAQLRATTIKTVYLLPMGEGEILEWQLPKMEETPLGEEYPFEELEWPSGIHLLAFVREEHCWFSDYPTALQMGDRLIMLISNQQQWLLLVQQLRQMIEKINPLLAQTL